MESRAVAAFFQITKLVWDLVLKRKETTLSEAYLSQVIFLKDDALCSHIIYDVAAD